MRKLNKIISVIAVILLLTSCSFNAVKKDEPEKTQYNVSGLVAGVTDDYLVLDSELIVTGTVKEIGKSKWSNPGFEKDMARNILQTDIFVEVDKIFKGEPKSEIIAVRINKGEDEKYQVASDGYPDFSIGEKVLLFLSYDDGDLKTDEDYYVLSGMYQGKFVPKDNLMTTYENCKDKERIFEIEELPQIIEKLHLENPNYEEEKAKRQAEIIENNKKLFGE
ncbi:MAG: hypothetical protein IKJ06_04910 [Clostridia bacterium]|nr:hypothetical protein [Clostridia bacterium]